MRCVVKEIYRIMFIDSAPEFIQWANCMNSGAESSLTFVNRFGLYDAGDKNGTKSKVLNHICGQLYLELNESLHANPLNQVGRPIQNNISNSHGHRTNCVNIVVPCHTNVFNIQRILTKWNCQTSNYDKVLHCPAHTRLPISVQMYNICWVINPNYERRDVTGFTASLVQSRAMAIKVWMNSGRAVKGEGIVISGRGHKGSYNVVNV